MKNHWTIISKYMLLILMVCNFSSCDNDDTKELEVEIILNKVSYLEFYDSERYQFSWDVESEEHHDFKYSLLLGTTGDNLEVKAKNLEQKYYDVKELEVGTTYYWQVEVIHRGITKKSHISVYKVYDVNDNSLR
ncbi:hypothetical protein DF185_06410 [Marinifilum breve]|uniref:Fibronectin type-III domain-containing protein n=1 Tax=Marinifilum breve TaxID=2184082 RepID=A0A2V4A106_9BACT|nr:hypothetical protein [Marinifilum breve]PXY02276.1 hypothetical protein DF185_06410 [Marinifilum breve]